MVKLYNFHIKVQPSVPLNLNNVKRLIFFLNSSFKKSASDANYHNLKYHCKDITGLETASDPSGSGSERYEQEILACSFSKLSLSMTWHQ